MNIKKDKQYKIGIKLETKEGKKILTFIDFHFDDYFDTLEMEGKNFEKNFENINNYYSGMNTSNGNEFLVSVLEDKLNIQIEWIEEIGII